ncbi:MAG TPA: class I SAM-dependent methyltransferase [Bacillota bacterium]|nr:class I SAM-dependent methyltransferase [Bacillota bacterium]
MEIQLSKRLLTIARMIPPGSLLADIGTDHAFLPVYLVQQGIVSRAIAGDVHPGPIKMAARTVAEAGLSDQIEVRMGDGLAVLRPADLESQPQAGGAESPGAPLTGAVIAGMGGGTIQGILAAKPEITAQLDFLILQPMVDAGPLRAWLLASGWVLAAEELVEEEGRLYEIIMARLGNAPQDSGLIDEVLLEVGPLLLAHHHPLLESHLDKLIQDKQRMLSQLAKSTSEQAKAKQVWAQNWLDRLVEIKRTQAGGA